MRSPITWRTHLSKVWVWTRKTRKPEIIRCGCQLKLIIYQTTWRVGLLDELIWRNCQQLELARHGSMFAGSSSSRSIKWSTRSQWLAMDTRTTLSLSGCSKDSLSNQRCTCTRTSFIIRLNSPHDSINVRCHMEEVTKNSITRLWTVSKSVKGALKRS